LRKDVDYLKSTDFTSLLKATEDQDSPPSSQMPPATTRDVPMDDVVAEESEEETSEKKLDVEEATIYEDLLDL